MENEKYLIDEIRTQIKATVSPCYENTSKTEIYCRCPECGDSLKDKRAAHLYIKMKPPFSYYCQKCGFSGVLNQELLERLNVFNNNVVLNINEANKTIDSSQKHYSYKKKELTFDYSDENTSLALASLEYFNNRFGVNETIENLNKKFKCVLEPKKYISKFNIDITKSKFDFEHSIGFVSSDNKYIICRDVTGNAEVRYSNTLLSEDQDCSKIYNIRTPINILDDKITLVITEGIFDAIGIYYKQYSDSENVIIAAGCGKSFSQVIDKFIKMGFLNLDVKIYSDADVDLSFYKKMKKMNYHLKHSTVEVFYNTLGKDCGVSKDNIELRKTII